MKRVVEGLLVLGLAGCAVTAPPPKDTHDRIKQELAKGAATKAVPDAVSSALLPPLNIEVPKAAAIPDERFNVTFNNLSAHQFFTAIASGTRYNMLVHPEVTGTVSVNLKDVTLFEALDAVRDLYGYEYKAEGNRIFIQPLSLQTRIFQVNYLTGVRRGISDIRVTSGSSGDTSSGGATGGAAGSAGGSTGAKTLETSKVSTTSTTDFWTDLKVALEAIIGMERAVTTGGVPGAAGAAPSTAAASAAAARGTTATGPASTALAPAGSSARSAAIAGAAPCRGGRCVIVNPQSGVVVVTAYPSELRSVSSFLRATQLSVDRQVMLEAKILEVQLNDGFQSGINWATFARFRGGANQVAAGLLQPGSTLQPLAPGTSFPQLIESLGATGIAAIPGLGIAAPDTNAGSVFGFAFQATNFAALISFLETQGTVNVLSSPRVATMNNQKAVLKIGTDELFVTNVTAASNQTVGNTTSQTPPTVTLQSYFSGIVLDVTPQIDDRGNVTLHIRPSVTQVSQINKQVNLGAQFGILQLPVPSNNTSETDTIVRGRDGQIIAIGGLMRYASTSDKSQIPAAGDVPGVGALFRNRNDSNQKRELVILIKPTIVTEGGGNWSEDLVETQRRIQQLEPPQHGKWPEGTPQR
jgi:MSHA biogenesis protein MshL